MTHHEDKLRVYAARQRLNDLLDEVQSSDTPSFTSDQVDLIERRLAEITDVLIGDIPTDIHGVLAANREIAIIWTIEDVKDRRPDLRDDQAWEVLAACKRQHDCNYGITWDTLDITAHMLFGSRNEHRVQRCDRALQDYNGDDDPQANLVDFLADAMHWCDENNRAFADVLRIAEEHFSVESKE